MWHSIFYVSLLALSTRAIKVPVDGKEENVSEPVKADKKQDTFYVSDDAVIDSYLIPPDAHRPAEVLPDLIVTPATYLLPPSPEKHLDYYAPTEAGEQTDWYPIAQVPPQSTPVNLLLPPRQSDVIPILVNNNQSFDIIENPRDGKAYEANRFIISVPSRQLEPPLENAPNDYELLKPSKEQELPSTDINQPFNVPAPEYKIPIVKPHRKNLKKIDPRLKKLQPIPLHLTPPKLFSEKYKNPTKLYPKKVTKGFQPIPIPLAEFAEDTPPEVPRAKPVKPFKPVTSDETEYFIPSDEKKIYVYNQAEEKRKLKGENENTLQQPVAAAEDTYGGNAPAEQETSATNYRHPGRNVYPAPLRQAPPAPPQPLQNNAQAPPPPGERTEFRMHGMKGPHSYQFGFDTGKGKNRQFRYEERDNDGHVKGHYGYVDKRGKLRVVNYDADPKTGFRAQAPVEAE